MNIPDFLVISAVNLVFFVLGYILGKPYLDKRINKALVEPKKEPPQLPTP